MKSSALWYLFVSGIALSCGPCMFTCGPALVAYSAASQKGGRGGLHIYFLFQGSKALVYLAITCVVYLLGKPLEQLLPVSITALLRALTGLFLIILGLVVVFKSSKGFSCPPGTGADCSKGTPGKAGVLLLGLLYGILPCLPLAGLIAYVMLISHTLSQALVYCASFAAGTLISPLVLLTSAAGYVPVFLGRHAKLIQYLRITCGIIIILTGSTYLNPHE